MSDETVDRQGPVSTSVPGAWQPTEEEVAAVVNAMDVDEPEWSKVVVARAILAAVGPAIAARALREAASIARDYDAAETDLLCRARADVLDPPSLSPDDKERG